MTSVEAAYGAEGANGDDDDDDVDAEDAQRALRAWEKKYQSERAWEDLEEDPVTGRLRVTSEAQTAKARRRPVCASRARRRRPRRANGARRWRRSRRARERRRD